MREVPVGGYRNSAMVDDEDYERVMALGRWKLVTQNGRQCIRRVDYRNCRGARGYVVLLHRFVLGIPAGTRMPRVAFKDDNIFNCQKDNLDVEVLGAVEGTKTITCTVCRETLPEHYFYLRNNGRYRQDCKECFSQRLKKINTPEVTRRKVLKYKYKLTPEQWEQRFDAQGRKCAICKKTEPTKKGWQTDHDHRCCPGARTCGQCLRGILCAPCNMFFGQAKENTTILKNAIAYFEQYANPISEVLP
jgi:hypothetical protein